MTAHPQSWQRSSVPSILKSRACRFSGYLLRERNYISTGILLFPSACFGKLLSPYAFCAAARNLTICPPDSNSSPSLRNSSSSSRDEKPSPRMITGSTFFIWVERTRLHIPEISEGCTCSLYGFCCICQCFAIPICNQSKPSYRAIAPHFSSACREPLYGRALKASLL